MGQAPCKGCEERHTSCHSHCDLYKEYKKSYDEDMRKKREYRDRDREYYSYVTESVERNSKKRKKKRGRRGDGDGFI